MASYAQENADNSIFIVKTEHIESYTDYVIEVRMCSYHWLVRHRYSEFHDLHEHLVAEHGVDKKLLPPKKTFGNTLDSFIQKRRGGLERYLQALLRQFEMIPFQLAMFLDFQKYEINGVTQILAETLFQRGEGLLEKDSVCSMDPLQLHAITDRLTKPQTVASSQRRDIGHILDFVTRLSKLRVIGTEKVVGTSNINMNSLEYSLSMFKAIKYLELVKVNVTKINGLDHVRQNVEKLKIKKSVSSLQDFLTHNILYWEDESGGQTCQNTAWPQLTWVDLSENSISELPECMRYLQKMEYLDMHDNYLEDIDNLESLSYLTHLDVSINKIQYLSDLHLKLGNLKSINLAGNKLETLEAFGRLYSLEYLDVSNNQISQVIELRYLDTLPLLETLTITGNPVTVVPDYRIQVLKIFGNRSKEVTLDNQKGDEKEMDTIAVLLALDHAKQPSKLKQPIKGGIKSKSSSNSDMSKNNAMTGASSSRAAAPPNNPPGELRLNTEIANTPPSTVQPRFDSPFNSPTRSSPESEQPFHSLSNSDSEAGERALSGTPSPTDETPPDRSPPDGASNNHEDKPVVVSQTTTQDTESDRNVTTQEAHIASEAVSDTGRSVGSSARSSPCVMYSVESGEEGQAAEGDHLVTDMEDEQKDVEKGVADTSNTETVQRDAEAGLNSAVEKSSPSMDEVCESTANDHRPKLSLNLSSQSSDEMNGDVPADDLLAGPLSPPVKVSIDVVDHLEQCLQNLPPIIKLDNSLESLRQMDGEEILNLFYHDAAIPRAGDSKEELCHAMWTSLITYTQPDIQEACLVLLTNQATYFIRAAGEDGIYNTCNISHGHLHEVMVGVGSQSVRLCGDSEEDCYTCLTVDASLVHVFVTRVTFIVDTDFARKSTESSPRISDSGSSDEEPSIYDEPSEAAQTNNSSDHPSGVRFVSCETQYTNDLESFLNSLNPEQTDLKIDMATCALCVINEKSECCTVAFTPENLYLITENYAHFPPPTCIKKEVQITEQFSLRRAIPLDKIAEQELYHDHALLKLSLTDDEIITLQCSSSAIANKLEEKISNIISYS